MRKKFICGNWKMYKTTASAREFAEDFKKIYQPKEGIEVAIGAPFTQLEALKEAFKGTDVAISSQNIHWADEGAFTGEVSAPMLKEIGIDYAIIGHSERRQYFGETDETVCKRALQALKYGILPIICVGEKLEERDAGTHFDLVKGQVEYFLSRMTKEEASCVTIAYEPIWAIGTGRTASPEQAQEMCAFIRSIARQIHGDELADKLIIQYGGSVKPANAKELLTQPDIDGALVGGASLKPEDFLAIINF